jgi:hypothetical protein
MNEEIRAQEPKVLWNKFADLNEVPRPSKKEERVIEFMKNFGNKLNLETLVDKVGNDISEILYPYFETLKNHDMNEDKFRGFISGLFDGLKMINDIMEYQTRYVLPIVNNNESDSESTIEFSSDFDSEDEKSEHDNKNLKRERDESEDSDNEYNERDNKRPRK